MTPIEKQITHFFRYALYILQLENYDLERFFNVLKETRLGFGRKQNKEIVWTPKMYAVLIISIVGYVYGIFSLITWILPLSYYSMILIWIAPFLLSFLYAIPLALATVILSPLDLILKESIVRKARKRLESFPNIKVVAITGSYGKTTMKEMVARVLEPHFNVVKTKENFNTPLGISEQILREIDKDTEVFVVEMGAHEAGDIKELCQIARPDISILTGINEAHLERFGSISTTIKTKFEIVTECAPDGVVILNADDMRVVKSAREFIGNQITHYYSSDNNSLSRYTYTNKIFDQDGGGLHFTLLRDKNLVGEIRTKILASYVIGNAVAGFIVGKEFGLSDAQIRSALLGVAPAPHRLSSARTPNNIVVVDDSYNGNPAGAKEALSVLSQFENRRKIYVTPGLVEMGSETEAVHRILGNQIAEVADLVFLVENSVSDYIHTGLQEKNFPERNINISQNSKEMHTRVAKELVSGDVVLYQNDWPDNYL